MRNTGKYTLFFLCEYLIEIIFWIINNNILHIMLICLNLEPVKDQRSKLIVSNTQQFLTRETVVI